MKGFRMRNVIGAALTMCLLTIGSQFASAATVSGGGSALIDAMAAALPGDSLEITDSLAYSTGYSGILCTSGVTIFSTQVPKPQISSGIGEALLLQNNTIMGVEITNSGLLLGGGSLTNFVAVQNVIGSGTSTLVDCDFIGNQVAVRINSGVADRLDMTECFFLSNEIAIITDTGTGTASKILNCTFQANGDALLPASLFPNNGAIIIRSEFIDIDIEGGSFLVNDTNTALGPVIPQASAIWVGDFAASGNFGTNLRIANNTIEATNTSFSVSLGNIHNFEMTGNVIKSGISLIAPVGGVLGDGTSVVGNNTFQDNSPGDGFEIAFSVIGPVEATFTHNAFISTRYILDGTTSVTKIQHHTFSKPALGINEPILLAGPAAPDTPVIRDNIFAGYARGLVRTNVNDAYLSTSNFPDGVGVIDTPFAVHNDYDSTDHLYSAAPMVGNNGQDPDFLDYANNDFSLGCDAGANILSDASDPLPMGSELQDPGCDGCAECPDVTAVIYGLYCDELIVLEQPSLLNAQLILNQLIDDQIALNAPICPGSLPLGGNHEDDCAALILAEIAALLASLP